MFVTSSLSLKQLSHAAFGHAARRQWSSAAATSSSAALREAMIGQPTPETHPHLMEPGQSNVEPMPIIRPWNSRLTYLIHPLSSHMNLGYLYTSDPFYLICYNKKSPLALHPENTLRDGKPSSTNYLTVLSLLSLVSVFGTRPTGSFTRFIKTQICFTCPGLMSRMLRWY
jgi:hypothetical protein